jgi:hypothetical protein
VWLYNSSHFEFPSRLIAGETDVAALSFVTASSELAIVSVPTGTEQLNLTL